MSKSLDYDVIVIGEGVSGLTAANLIAAGGARVATIERGLFGGLVANINVLRPAPEGGAGSGADLAVGLVESNSERGVTSLPEEVEGISVEGGLRVLAGKRSLSARAVVVASGARLRKLGVPGETQFEGRGVSQCADCDGPLFNGAEVVVVGGGDSALQEALVLTEFCARVHIVHRGGAFRADPELVGEVSSHSRIATLFETRVESIRGTKMVEAVTLRGADGRNRELKCEGVFAYIGLEPNSAFVPPAVEKDGEGYVMTRAGLETSVPGLWAIGAVRAGFGGRLVDASEDARHVADVVGAFVR